MNGWKKTVVAVLILTVVLQCAWLCVSAVNAEFSALSEDRDSVLVDVVKDPEAPSDFVTEFPAELFLSELEAKSPAVEPAVREIFEEIPVYMQESYSHALYGDGTVASCGSSITALAMMATYLTGYTYQPDELAHSFAGKAETHADRVSYAAEVLGLSFENTDRWDELLTALKSGKYAIVQLSAGSVFSEAEHFVVLRGVDEELLVETVEQEDGTTEEITTVIYKILVNDPCGANHEAETLQEKFSVGFEETDISESLCAAWIFDPAAVAEDIQRHTESFQEADGKRYKALNLTLAEKQLLARVVYVKGYGECAEGQQALVEVLLNRMLSEEFPDVLRDLVYGKNGLCDLEVLSEIELTALEYTIVNRAIYGPYVLSEDVTDFSYVCHKA